MVVGAGQANNSWERSPIFRSMQEPQKEFVRQELYKLNFIEQVDNELMEASEDTCG